MAGDRPMRAASGQDKVLQGRVRQGVAGPGRGTAGDGRRRTPDSGVGASLIENLDAEEVLGGLQTRWLGRRLEVHTQTTSTNDDGARLARAGAASGTVVVADWQSAGRGRRGRRWLAPPGTAALLSVVLRPPLPARAVGRLGMAAALSVVEAVWRACAVQAACKYPNDVLVGGRKVAGVLPEAHLAGDLVEWAVLGIGINVRAAAVPPGLEHRATSIEEHVAPPARSALIRAVLDSLEPRLELAETRPEALAEEWRACDSVLGRRVSFAIGQTRLHGVAADVDGDGWLLLRTPDGVERWLAPAEVSLAPC